MNITTTKKLNINSSKEILLLRYIPQDKLGIKQMYMKSEFNFSSTPPNFVCLFKILDNNLLSSFTVYDNSNSLYIYSINDFVEEELDATLFSFELENYPDIEVIDFR